MYDPNGGRLSIGWRGFVRESLWQRLFLQISGLFPKDLQLCAFSDSSLLTSSSWALFFLIIPLSLLY